MPLGSKMASKRKIGVVVLRCSAEFETYAPLVMRMATWVALLYQDNCDFEHKKRERGHFAVLI